MARRWTENYKEDIEERIFDDLSKEEDRRDKTTRGRGFPNLERLPIGIGRYLKLSVMFLDICGFSSRNCDSRQDQLDNLTVLNMFIPEMMRIVNDYEGVVEKNTGDGLMAYFGSEWIEKKDKARLAIEASMTMHYVNEKHINPLLEEIGIKPIKFRIGIDLGNVLIAQIGNPRRFAPHVAIGTTANIACRLLEYAGPGEVLIGGDVYSALSASYKHYCKPCNLDWSFVWGKRKTKYPAFEYQGRRY